MSSDHIMHRRPLVCIGLGGISEGYLHDVLLLHQTGVVPFSHIFLIDGKTFSPEKRVRQHFLSDAPRPKAAERVDMWTQMFPDAPLLAVNTFVDRENVGRYVRNGSIVLLSPDNNPTRALVSAHAETLDTVLLINGGNEGIEGKEDGTEGIVQVHWKVDREDRTPPITKYHPEIAASDERLPSEMSCEELARAGQPQVLGTNLMVGWWMAHMLWRYCTLPSEEATRIVELWANSRTGDVNPYPIGERSP